MYPENLMAISQNFQSADVVRSFSRVVGESFEKTQQALKSVIPIILHGLITKSESPLGPDHLIRLLNKDSIEMKLISNLDNEYVLFTGGDALARIFGSDLDSVTDNLGQSLEIESGHVKKMMSLAVPFVMGMIGLKMRREGLSPSGLADVLIEQKSSLNTTSGAPEYKNNLYSQSDPTIESTWFALSLVALLLAVLIWWSSANL